MPNDEKIDALDADVILRALGPPERDFRVHKLILSLASPVLKVTLSLSRPTRPTPGSSNAVHIVQVNDSSHALAIVLKMIYPGIPPSLNRDLDTLVECLVVARKYQMQGVLAKLRDALSRVKDPLRVYAIASRFGFTDLAETTFRNMLPSVSFAETPQLPDDFEFVPATVYHKLVRQRARYLDTVVETIRQAPFQHPCSCCRGGLVNGELFRLRFANLIMKGTPADFPACLTAWVKAYGLNAECEDDCVATFIRAAISMVTRWLDNTGESNPKRRSILTI